MFQLLDDSKLKNIIFQQQIHFSGLIWLP